MKLFGKLKLSHQILAILLIIPSFIIVVLLYYSALQHVNIQNKPLEQLALSTSAALAEKTDRNLQKCISDVKAFAFSKLAIDAINNKNQDSSLVVFMNTMTTYYDIYDVTMLCDLTGKVIAVNTRDNNQNVILSTFLKSKNMNGEEWFRSSIVAGGPKGGVYYSDFNQDDDIMQLYNNKGYGINFSAPVRDAGGTIIGVWRNRASWKELTQKIRKEAEISLQKDIKNAIILLLDKQGHLIDADNENNILKLTIGKNNLFKKYNFDYSGININEDDYLYGWSPLQEFNSVGGKWHFLTLLPKVKLSDNAIYLHSDWTKLTILSFSMLIFAIVISIFFVTKFSKRMKAIKNSVLQLSKGKIIKIENIKYKDEIGEMSIAINTLSQNFNDIAYFSNEIGKGNLSTNYTLLGEEDVLGTSLLKMQLNLKAVEKENNLQKWESEKLEQIGELIRNQEEPELKFKKAISFLSKSIQAYQGALFVIKQDEFPLMIELKSGFALTSKHLDMVPFMMGENLAGQCIKDNELKRLNNIPETFINVINSGLGASMPTEIIVLPITFNNKVEGAVEFASFKPITVNQIRFLEKAIEYIGSYIAQLRINNQEKKIYNDPVY